MDITTKDIIKMMPFEEAFKTELLGKFDSLGADERYEVERLLWGLYDAIYTLKLQGKIEMAMSPDAAVKVALDQNFYKKIRDEVEQEMDSEATSTIDSADLQAAREKLQSMIKQSE